MIIHVWRRDVEADLGPVIAASANPRIAGAIEHCGGGAISTNPEPHSGSDRIACALGQFDPEGVYDTVINFQGDMPTVDPVVLATAADPLREHRFDLATLACPIRDSDELSRPSVVKVAMEPKDAMARRGRAIYFGYSRIPHGASAFLHHIGVYAYTRQALARFVSAPQIALENAERLEQLRALAAGLSIVVAFVDAKPLGVDAEEDLNEARRHLESAFALTRRSSPGHPAMP